MVVLKTPVALAMLGILMFIPRLSATQKQETKIGEASTPDVLKDTDSYRVYVLLDGDKPDTFTYDDIRVDVELKLRQNGIHIITDKEFLATPYPSRLVITVSILKPKNEVSGISIFAATFQVIETMQSLRNPKQRVVGVITWETAKYGAVARLQQTNNIRDTVKALTDKFLNDYLTANPKK